MKPIEELINFGIINIDKPAGPTSFSVSHLVAKKLNLKKASHMGTLDPKVTGVLPITLGRACKLAEYFIKHDKGYVGILHTHKEQKIEELQNLVDKNFLGKIKQTPPHKSAVKRVEREREVYCFKFLEASEDGRNFLFYCEVEGGTYIRKICSDIGEKIGGAHMEELRRTSAGIFNEEKIYTLYDLDKAIEEWKNGDEKSLREMIVPAEDAIRKIMPSAKVGKNAIKKIYQGKPVTKKDIQGEVPKEERFAVFHGELFVAILRKVKEKGILARSEFVFSPFK